MTFDPGRDAEGLRKALLHLMEESYTLGRVQPMLDKADEATREKLLQQVPKRNLGEGYYVLGDYLIWLSLCMERSGLLKDPTAVELNGLTILAAARAEFEREHPPCWQCGERQDNRFASCCHECGAKFRRE